MTMLAIAGLLFLGIHAIPATGLRGRAVAAVGEDRYAGLFAALSIASFLFWVWAFESTAGSERAWAYPGWWPWLKAAILLFAFVLFVGGATSPNPTGMRQGQLFERSDTGSGIFAITRHPLMWAFGLWGLAHLISQPDWRGFWFFGLFAVTAIGGPGCRSAAKRENTGRIGSVLRPGRLSCHSRRWLGGRRASASPRSAGGASRWPCCSGRRSCTCIHGFSGRRHCRVDCHAVGG